MRGLTVDLELDLESRGEHEVNHDALKARIDERRNW